MAEWLIEDGIGETRAALVDAGRILAARIELPGLRLGTVARARLAEPLLARLDTGEEVMLDRAPAGVTLGAALTVEVTREPIPEPGRPKRARGRATDAAPVAGATLAHRLTGVPVRRLAAHQLDALEAAGWSEVLGEAETGDIAFPGGALRLSPTPAMTLFDVDGAGDLDSLALAAARAVGQAVVRHDIGGSIGIDFPTITGKAARQAVAAALDAALADAGPFERTAVNGFGFLQLVRPRQRASLPELLRADPVGAALRATLRRWEREPFGTPLGPLPPAHAARLAAEPEWHAELVRRLGRDPISLS